MTERAGTPLHASFSSILATLLRRGGPTAVAASSIGALAVATPLWLLAQTQPWHVFPERELFLGVLPFTAAVAAGSFPVFAVALERTPTVGEGLGLAVRAVPWMLVLALAAAAGLGAMHILKFLVDALLAHGIRELKVLFFAPFLAIFSVSFWTFLFALPAAKASMRSRAETGPTSLLAGAPLFALLVLELPDSGHWLWRGTLGVPVRVKLAGAIIAYAAIIVTTAALAVTAHAVDSGRGAGEDPA